MSELAGSPDEEVDFLPGLDGISRFFRIDGLSTPLHVAVKRSRQPSIVAELIAGGANPNAKDVDGETPLHQVKTAADAALLMEAGADLNARDKAGYTPLHDAMYGTSGAEVSALISALIDGGAAPDARTASGVTPLYILADWASYADIESANPISLLIRSGADPNSQDDYGRTPLHFLMDSGAANLDVAGILIAAGADPNVRNDKGQSPLFNAVVPSRNYLGVGRAQHVIVERLVELGADPNLRDETGRSPLHHALSHFSDFEYDPDDFEQLRPRPYSDEPTIQALLDAGADATLADENGMTPWELAQGNQALKGTKTFWRLNEARFD